MLPYVVQREVFEFLALQVSQCKIILATALLSSPKVHPLHRDYEMGFSHYLIRYKAVFMARASLGIQST